MKKDVTNERKLTGRRLHGERQRKKRGVMKKRCHGGKRRHGDFTEDRDRGGDEASRFLVTSRMREAEEVTNRRKR
ncbi:unnamed protein product [Brassica oleracea]